jgi:hypothetical protein
LPRAKMCGQYRMQRSVTVRCVRFSFSVLSLSSAVRYRNPSLLPKYIAPAQGQNLRRAQRGRSTGEQQRVVKRGRERFQDRHGLGRGDDDRPVAGLGTRLDVQHGILCDVFVQDADFVDAVH